MTSESPAILSDGLIRAAAAAAPVTVSSRTDDIPASWDERTVLVTMLDYARDTGVRPRRPQVRPFWWGFDLPLAWLNAAMVLPLLAAAWAVYRKTSRNPGESRRSSA